MPLKMYGAIVFVLWGPIQSLQCEIYRDIYNKEFYVILYKLYKFCIIKVLQILRCNNNM